MRSAEFDQSAKSPRINYVIAPERWVGGVSTSTPGPDKSPEKKSRKGLVIALASGLAGAAVAAAAIFGIGNAGEAPSPQPTAEAPADPSEPTPEAPASPELSVADIEIQAGLSAEQVGQAIIERFDDWRNEGGSDPAIRAEWLDSAGTNGEFALAKAEEFAALYAEALYVDGWQSHDDLVGNYEFGIRANASTLEMNLKTSNPTENPDDLEPYQRNIVFDGARELSSGDGTRVIEIDFTESNNADQNRAGEAFGPETATFGQPTGRFTMTLVTVDGVERIAQTAVADR